MSNTADNVLINTDSRLFYISDHIDNDSIGKMCFNLLYLLKQDDDEETEKKDFKRKPIKIYINSYGGKIYDMWALIDIIEKSKTPIYTYCTGYAMSAAFEIFLAGHKRFGSRHSTFMYHQMSHYNYGKYQDLVEDREEMNFLNKSNEQYVIERTKIPEHYINEIREKKKDVYFHANTALEYGIIDEII